MPQTQSRQEVSDVPEGELRSRYSRLIELLRKGTPLADQYHDEKEVLQDELKNRGISPTDVA